MGSDKQDYTLGISILEQALANLTAVVSASALDIRALNSADKAHIPLPYDVVGYKLSNTSTVSDGSVYTHALDEDDWGAGLDFYPVFFTFVLNVTTANSWDQWFQGIFVEIRELSGETLLFEYAKTYSVRSHPPVLDSINGRKHLYDSISLYNNKITSGNDFACYIRNRTGGDWAAGSVYTYIGGISK